MELTSPLFFYSLGGLVLAYWFFPARARNGLLLAGSYALYAAWDFRFLGVLLLCTALDFFFAQWISNESSKRIRKWLAGVSIVGNLAILGCFKYLYFFSGLFGFKPSEWAPLYIPLGISFYTFHSISYIVDVYRKRVPAILSPVNYALYVSFFPKLIAGPIERVERFLPQITEKKFFRSELFERALKIFLLGLFLKLCVGDRLSYVAAQAFDSKLAPGSVLAWAGLYAFTFQIYADFLGYTLIATGSALFFGIELSKNFNHPYLSATPQDFWRRWHISLSTWFRDYVYLPLGGNRTLRTRNILITMVVAGLWHGADLKFIAWGLFHGLILAAQLFIVGGNRELSRTQRWLGIFLTFHLVALGWVFFRSQSFSHALEYFSFLFQWPSPPNRQTWALCVWVLFLLAIWQTVWFLQRKVITGARGSNFLISIAGYFFMGLLLMITILLGVTGAEPFLYFHF